MFFTLFGYWVPGGGGLPRDWYTTYLGTYRHIHSAFVAGPSKEWIHYWVSSPPPYISPCTPVPYPPSPRHRNPKMPYPTLGVHLQQPFWGYCNPRPLWGSVFDPPHFVVCNSFGAGVGWLLMSRPALNTRGPCMRMHTSDQWHFGDRGPQSVVDSPWPL